MELIYQTEIRAMNLLWLGEEELIICSDSIFNFFHVHSLKSQPAIKQLSDLNGLCYLGKMLLLEEQPNEKRLLLLIDPFDNYGFSYFHLDESLVKPYNPDNPFEEPVRQTLFDSSVQELFATESQQDIQVSPDGHLVAIRGDRSVCIFETVSGKLLRKIDDTTLQANTDKIELHLERFYRYADIFWLNERLLTLVKADTSFFFQFQLLVIDVETGSGIGELPMLSPPEYFSTLLVNQKKIFTSMANGLVIIDREDWGSYEIIKHPHTLIQDMFFSYDGQSLITIGQEHYFNCYEKATEIQGPNDLELIWIDPNNKQIQKREILPINYSEVYPNPFGPTLAFIDSSSKNLSIWKYEISKSPKI
ncbi:hypothetical protein COW36_11725 [bacterium (Candidatus Blackallbacteria) CG17_big_fil_post_rev_8_21_14_2_50_48_46]|uniref:WD40 repeat domain-containing protein n=1 Tax=bacterium (Candidatus Blackallbacteria) CG17_big_fil_post_rev_8_21_14_2_50_48_46 TaxID=2014261 RepID=A0A2M7G3I7_9BACT|nr:MAG: hypothetical protein COW64_03540 [bacterium (Candidatus Blackallbacteria) CG18_big_fil_WC_8_21_14_2_50_49_26]PIW16432.1 MAG: hypothetical protein COW36_11725 [bacterium (Candidatus Blackallbacteria) CG17_big_fil_post_rev_8_21_14_2_50_48_46]PIW45940.1 MAG: hypothetical protein COW20_16990 [bacterium (Candidatus Blackallbacteria) CG13_big_fil_rev_8_21_14_2_50_49_14]